MAGQISSWLLQCYLLLLLVHPLDPSSQPGQGKGTRGLNAEELELQDLDPEPTLWANISRLFWTCLLVELLITAIVLGYYLYRRFWRRRRQEKQQTPRNCCPGQGCPTKLIQLLRHNRAMLQLCLHHYSQQRTKAKRAAQRAGWKRRRPRTLSPASELHAKRCRECVTGAQPRHCDIPHLRR